jgi:hypothetical protein
MMNVYFGQIYVTPGVRFPFSHHFQQHLSEAITSIITPSRKLIEKYGGDCNIVFNISAKKSTQVTDIKGPTYFEKTNDVEYSLFLPFDVISRDSEPSPSALRYLLNGVCEVLKSLDIDIARVMERRDSLITQICADPSMFKEK